MCGSSGSLLEREGSGKVHVIHYWGDDSMQWCSKEEAGAPVFRSLCIFHPLGLYCQHINKKGHLAAPYALDFMQHLWEDLGGTVFHSHQRLTVLLHEVLSENILVSSWKTLTIVETGRKNPIYKFSFKNNFQNNFLPLTEISKCSKIIISKLLFLVKGASCILFVLSCYSWVTGVQKNSEF